MFNIKDKGIQTAIKKHAAKEPVKVQETKYSGKGTRARLNTGAYKMFFGSKASK